MILKWGYFCPLVGFIHCKIHSLLLVIRLVKIGIRDFMKISAILAGDAVDMCPVILMTDPI